MRITLAESIRLQNQTNKLVANMTQNNNAQYQYGKKTVGKYLKDKRNIEKYNKAMEEFLR